MLLLPALLAALWCLVAFLGVARHFVEMPQAIWVPLYAVHFWLSVLTFGASPSAARARFTMRGRLAIRCGTAAILIIPAALSVKRIAPTWFDQHEINPFPVSMVASLLTAGLALIGLTRLRDSRAPWKWVEIGTGHLHLLLAMVGAGCLVDVPAPGGTPWLIPSVYVLWLGCMLWTWRAVARSRSGA